VWGGSPHLHNASLPAVDIRLQDKLSAAKIGFWGAEAPTSQFLLLPAVASRLQDMPSAAESGVLGAAALTCQVYRVRSRPAEITKGAKQAAFYPGMRHFLQSLTLRLASLLFLPAASLFHEALTVA
jgi:hypothetical protein